MTPNRVMSQCLTSIRSAELVRVTHSNNKQPHRPEWTFTTLSNITVTKDPATPHIILFVHAEWSAPLQHSSVPKALYSESLGATSWATVAHILSFSDVHSGHLFVFLEVMTVSHKLCAVLCCDLSSHCLSFCSVWFLCLTKRRVQSIYLSHL